MGLSFLSDFTGHLSSYLTSIISHGISYQSPTHRPRCQPAVVCQLPAAIAQAMEFEKGETVEWIIADKGHLILSREVVPPNPVPIKKKPH